MIYQAEFSSASHECKEAELNSASQGQKKTRIDESGFSN